MVFAPRNIYCAEEIVFSYSKQYFHQHIAVKVYFRLWIIYIFDVRNRHTDECGDAYILLKLSYYDPDTDALSRNI